MPAFQISLTAAAIVTDGGAVPQVTIVQLSAPGLAVFGRQEVQQLRDACQMALDAADAFAKPSPAGHTSKGTP